MPFSGTWIDKDPLNDSSVSVAGDVATLTVPSGSSHDMWTTVKGAQQYVKALVDQTSVFDIYVKVLTKPAANSQIAGLIAKVDDTHFIRCDFNTTVAGGTTINVFLNRVNGASTFGPSAVNLGDLTFPYYIRLTRTAGNIFTAYTSPDGTTWTSRATHNPGPISIAEAGIFAGAAGTNPGFTAQFSEFQVDVPPAGVTVDAVIVEPSYDIVTANVDVVTEVEAVITEGRSGVNASSGYDFFNAIILVRETIFPNLEDRVMEVTTIEGTGPVTLLGNIVGYSLFADRYALNIQFPYVIKHETANESESGYGKLTSINTVERTLVTASTNNNALVNFSAGNKRIFVEATSDVMAKIFDTIGTILNRLDAGGL